MLVLEPLERAIARGAPMLAEVCGFGMTSDAHHLTSASLAGPRDAMRLALDEAGLNPEDVDYINAHGTGTPGNDSNEVAAIRAAFGVAAENLLVSSTKSMHGHVLGGAGAIEAVATVLALRDGIAPPTVNYSEPDPECDLDVVPHEARSTELRAAISNSFAFGGLNAVIALRRWD